MTSDSTADPRSAGNLSRRRLLAGGALVSAGAATAFGRPSAANAQPAPQRHRRAEDFDDDVTIAGNLSVDGDAIFMSGRPWLDVRAFGAVGDGTTDDTDAIQQAVAAIPAEGGTLFFPRGEYYVAGSIEVSNLVNVTVSGDQATLTQHTAYAKTISFSGVTGLRVRDLSFIGVGTEHNGTNTSYNGVAGLFFQDCQGVWVERCILKNHAGGAIRWSGSLQDAWFRSNWVIGIGSAGGINAGDNNSDFAIGNFAPTLNKNISICSNDLSNTCFGIGVTFSDGLVVSGNIIRDLPGQHGMYLSACSGVEVVGNYISGTAGIGIKNQISEAATADVYDNVVAGNTITTCQSGIVWASTTPNGTLRHFHNVIITSNLVRNAEQYGIYHTTGVGTKIHNNVIDTTGTYGMYFASVSAEVSSNTIVRSQWDAIYATIDDNTQFRDNQFLDCALNDAGGSSSDTKWIYHMYVGRASSASVTTPLATFDRNMHRSSGSGPATLSQIARTGTAVGVIWKDIVNFTDRGWQFGVAGELVYANIGYSPTADFVSSANLNPSSPTGGRGRRDYYGTQSPSDAGTTIVHFRQGDICWKSNPGSTDPVGWVCTATGAPGSWRAFGTPS